MIFQIRHRTTYRYEAAVGFARCVLRLTPNSSHSQTVLQSTVTVTPSPTECVVRTGPFGEQTRTVLIDKPHRSLVIEGLSRVDVHAAPVGRPENSDAWETIRTRAFDNPDLGPEGPAAYAYPTRRAPVLSQITSYARDSFSQGRPVLEAAIDLMNRIHEDFTYDSDATEVSTPAAEAFEKRRGVCQDFAHVMISGLRGLGLPAAYVSGYLRTTPPPGRPRLEGADATHAWVDLWCGEDAGWIGLDPTNALVVQNDHIVLARGRDYSDVAPIDGVILAPGEQALKVEVDVTPEAELPADTPTFALQDLQ